MLLRLATSQFDTLGDIRLKVTVRKYWLVTCMEVEVEA